MDKHSFPNGKRLVRDTLKPDDNLHYEKFSDGAVKCIEDEIPFELPDNWEWVRLGAICPYGDNKAIPSDSISESSWILDLEDIEKDIGLIKHYATKTERNSVSNKYAFTTGQLLYSKLRPYLNKVVIATKDGYCTTEILPLIFYGNISAKYMQIFMMSPTFLAYVNMISYGVKMPRLGTSDGKNALIAIPPINEQLRIREQFDIIIPLLRKIEKHSDTLHSNVLATKSKILDLAIRGKLVPQDPNDEPASILLERIRAEKEELIKQGKIKRDKKESVIFKGDDNSYYLRSSDNNSYDVAMIFNLPKNWEWCLLGDIFNVSSSKRVLKNEWKSSGVPFYRAREIVKLSINGTVDNDLFISPEHYENLRKNYGVPNAGDLMVTGVGTIGKVYIVKENDVFYYKDASVLCFENIYKAINPKFAKLMLDSSLIQNQIHSKTYGNTVDTITISTAKNYLCVLPPLAEQKRIVDEIEKIFAVLDDIANQVA